MKQTALLWYADGMNERVDILGAGLAGSEAALQLADRGVQVDLYEMRPVRKTPVHTTDNCAELVCSNSLKSMNPDSAAGMLKYELSALNSQLLTLAEQHKVDAGGALAVDRDAFAADVTKKITDHPNITLIRKEITQLESNANALIVATGPLTSDALSESILRHTGVDHFAFFDAAAPIVMAESLDHKKLFSQSRYEEGVGDYLNAPFPKEEYEHFIHELVNAKRVIAKEFEQRELFQACQPIEEIARKGLDAPRYGALKPVGLTDPNTGRRPWAALQLRAEDANATSYNLVGCQTNLTFSEQQRVFRLIPGLENAEFARYGVMHRNTFIDAPRLLDRHFKLIHDPGRFTDSHKTPIYFAGQITGTEGYSEAIMSGLYVALCVFAQLHKTELPMLPKATVTGALFDHATDPLTDPYQPMHVNFGIIPPLEPTIKNKKQRYQAYAERGRSAIESYVADLRNSSLIG